MPKIVKMPAPDSTAQMSANQTVRATTALREMLLQGRLRPGERVREVPLALELNISRVPLRIALERLANEGFLEVFKKRGFIVQRFSTEDIFDVVELRGVVEGVAARRAAEQLTDPSTLEPLKEVNEALLKLVRRRRMSAEEFHRYIALNSRFHAGLLNLAPGRMLRRAIERSYLLPFASPSAFLQRQKITPSLLELALVGADQHRRIIEAIESRQGMRAEALTREHALLAYQSFEDALKFDDLSRKADGGRLLFP